MPCLQPGRDELTERYVRGELGEAEREEFEAHYFECDDCLEELEIRYSLRETLAKTRSAIEARAPARLTELWKLWLPAAAVLLVALGLAFWLRPGPSDALSKLARIEPPAYEPVRLRGGEDEATASFRQAMELYRQGEYAAAIPGLEAASRLDPEAPDFAFFLGSCYLLTGQTDQGIESLRRTVRLGDTAYLEEALLLLARAHLGKGDLGKARADLENALQLQGDRESEARRLLKEVEDLRRGPG